MQQHQQLDRSIRPQGIVHHRSDIDTNQAHITAQFQHGHGMEEHDQTEDRAELILLLADIIDRANSHDKGRDGKKTQFPFIIFFFRHSMVFYATNDWIYSSSDFPSSS